MPYNPPFSIIVPCRNEEDRLPDTIEQILQYLSNFPNNPPEIILSIETSTDRTLEIARSAQNRHPSIYAYDLRAAKGKGYNVKQGMLAASGEFIFFTDADLSVPLHCVQTYLDSFVKSPSIDILIGNRKHAQSKIVKQPFLRHLGGNLISLFTRAIGLSEVPDTQCGFKAFRKHTAHEIFSRTQINGFSFDLEVLTLAKLLNHSVMSLPVEWKDKPKSKVRPLKDGLLLIKDAITLRLKTLLGLQRFCTNTIPHGIPKGNQ
jgi:dolichyl-phosphate beta-glucosyltransferase